MGEGANLGLSPGAPRIIACDMIWQIFAACWGFGGGEGGREGADTLKVAWQNFLRATISLNEHKCVNI